MATDGKSGNPLTMKEKTEDESDVASDAGQHEQGNHIGANESDDDLNSNLNSKWDDSFKRLLKFKEEHGHCLVPNRYPADNHLGSWVSTQRRQYKLMIGDSGASTPMTPARAQRLEAIGFCWTTKDPRHVPWEKRFEELAAFKEQYGHCQVPIGWEKNVPLSNWVSTQRQEFKLMIKNRSTRLTPERIRSLESLGFIWEAQRGGPRRQQRATVSVPEQAHPVQARNKARKIDYAQMMNGSPQMMMPGGFPMMPFPGMMMPGMFSQPSKDGKGENSVDGKVGDMKGDDASASKHPYWNPQMMMNPQMLAAMGWPMMPAGSPGSPPMAFGFFPMASPFMMGAAMGWPSAAAETSTAQSENGAKVAKKRKADTEPDAESTNKSETARKEETNKEDIADAPEDDGATESEED